MPMDWVVDIGKILSYSGDIMLPPILLVVPKWFLRRMNSAEGEEDQVVRVRASRWGVPIPPGLPIPLGSDSLDGRVDAEWPGKYGRQERTFWCHSLETVTITSCVRIDARVSAAATGVAHKHAVLFGPFIRNTENVKP